MTVEFKDYLNDIERFFVLVRRSGFVLSAKDCEKVRQWYVRGVPLRVVLEGIAEGYKTFRFHAAPGVRPPHNLSYYGHIIGAKVRAFRKVVVPAPPSAVPESEVVEALRHLVAEAHLACQTEERALENSIKSELGQRLEALLARAVKDNMDRQATAHALTLLDDEMMSLYDSRLEEERRTEMMHRVQAQLPGPTQMSPRAREGRKIALLKSILREELGILEMVS